ncbi:cell surface protein [Secundilactobacillus silagincola]|uniref:Cell surface protein n=1 Tax=Secundilactobacillus silagincola TaxID=1714681 RepID=A0A1Z5J1Q0_9LACO|nr:KxYKxGKxW signal peptide domain-containing protein [Secundilactobacillus silagincola]GAX07973.1 cell surface protein [Secundilactobacillus silagincola]
MVGKNNHIRTVKSNLKEHYKAYKAGRRWVYASLASLALGAGLLLGSTTAFADEVATTTLDPAASVTKDAGSAATTQTASTVPLKASTTVADTSNTTAVDSSNKQAADNANESANADVKPSANVKSSDTTTASVGKSADTAAQNTPAMTSDATAAKQASTPTAAATPAASSSEKQPSASSKTLVNPTKEQLNAAKKSAEQVYDATHQAQEIDAVAGDPGQTADATWTLSTDKIGYGSGITKPFTATIKISGKAGDKYVINLPADTHVFQYDPGSEQPLPAAAGTTTRTQNDDGTYTVTDTFNTTASVTQVFTFNVINNAKATFGPMEDVGKTVTKEITWSENDVAQTPVTFTQTITPTVNLSSVVQTYPSAKNVAEILPNQNYVFSLKVNETNGVLDNGGASDLVNRGDNIGGTTVTIPVPTGFKLDADDTKAMNAFSDAQTITQPNGPGTDLVVTAPAGSGGENYLNDGLGYKFIGSFVMTQPAADTVFTASSPVSFNQVLSDGGTLAATGTPWSVKILGVNSGGSGIGNGVAITKADGSLSNLLLDDDPTDDPSYLSSYTFSVDSAGDTTGAKIQINIANGLDATSIQTPSAGITPKLYLPGTTSYDYTLTLADGSTQTGTVNAGGKITSTSAIRTAVFTPNYLTPGANDTRAGGLNPNNPVPTTGTFERFIVGGNLSATYDDGSPVKAGDKLVSSSGLIFADQTVPDTTTVSSITQTVVDAVAYGMGYMDESNKAPGAQNAGDLRTGGGSYGQSSQKIYEPTYYFVVPTATSVSNVTALPEAKISTFKADDGKTVVKVDYSGTGVTISTNEFTGVNGKVFLSNNPDALPGSYPYLMYIVSPSTKLMNTTKVVDTSYTDGNPNAFLLQSGSGNWSIVTASAFYNTTLAKGNADTDAVAAGTSDDQGDPTLTFYDNIVNTSLDAGDVASSASVAINLPTIGDSKESQYTFNLTGPVTVPANYTTVSGNGAPITSTVLYSTQPQAVNTNATAPDTTGYVTADQVTDWSTIRSVVVSINGIQPNTSTGRIALTGTTKDFNEQAGKTGTLQTIFYGNGAKASVNPKGDASIAITGTSTIKARYHYTDNTGADQYIDLDDLNKTLNDNKDTFNGNDYPTSLAGFSANDQALIPAGYKLVTDVSGKATPTIIDGTGDGKAVFGQVAQYYYDGDFVQYELVGETSAQVKLVDDNNRGAVVGTPKNISGAPGTTANWTMPTIPAGYQLVAGQATSGTYTFAADNNVPVLIHVTHILDHSTKTTTRTITYAVDDPNYTNQVPETQTQKIIWKITSDEATGTSFATPTGVYSEQNAPTIKGYTPDKTQIDQEVFNGMATSGIPDDEPVTVTYHADKQQATVEFVDDGNNGAVVGTPTTINGTTSGSANWTADNIPSKYILAKGQAASGTYQFTNGTDQVVKIHLTHVMDYSTATTTRTIMYVVDDPNYTGQVPETQIQKLNWNVVKDTVTGATVATPVGIYSAQTAPTIDGYTADPTTISKEVFDGTTTLPQNEKVEVHYTANDQQVTVEYVDDDNAGAVVGTPTTLTGKTSGTANWNTDNLPTGYQLAQGQAASGTYQFNNTDNRTVKIHLNHVVDYSTQKTNRTITYTVDDSNYTGQVPETQTQTITWKITTDEATGTSFATPTGIYSEQTVPAIDGYTPNQDKVEQVTYNGMDASGIPGDDTVKIIYHANAQKVIVEYVDDSNNGAVVGTPETVSGQTSGTVDWNTDNLPAGYKLAKGQAASGTYQFNNDKNQTVQIHLSHIIDNTTATTTRTINYVVNDASYPGQAPETQTQTITWDVATDEVTHASVAVPQGGYAAQTIPTISGYTATIDNVADTATAVAAKNYGGVATSQMPKNETVTVTYTPNAQTVTVEYVDDAKGGAVVGNPTTINGKTFGTATWNTDNMPVGYKLAKGQAASGTYQFTYGTNQTIKIHLSHIIDNTTATTTRTIIYVVDDANYTGQVPETQTQTITWNIATDEVTGASEAVPQSGYAKQDVPTINGYTADPTAVQTLNYGAVLKDNLPAPEKITVTYTPNKASATVEYVDDAKGGAIVGTPTIISGKTSGTATWDTTNLPAGYKLAKGQAASGTYQFTNNSDQTIKIHLNHVIDNTTATTTRTITYVVDDPNYTDQVPAAKTQTITWNVTTDEVNGASVAVPQSGYSSQNAPEIPGYTPDSATVQAQNYGAAIKGKLPDSEAVTVTYTPNVQSAQVEYVDDANGGAVVGNPTTITGKTSGTATWNTDNIPTGYKLAKGQATSGTYQFTNDGNQAVQIHLSHIIDNTTATTTRTITYVVNDPNYTGQVPAAKTQAITWNVTTDEVNGHMVAIPQSGYAEETAPTLDGYTADPLSVAQESYAGVTSLPDNETATVTYTPNNQTVTLEYVDDDNDGAVVGTPTTLSGKTSGKVDWNTDNKPTGYSLTAGQAGSGTYQFTAGSDQLIQVHLNHVIEYTTTRTTRTVHFVVDDPNYTGQTPAPMVQTVIWNVATDKATGVSVATPQTGYYEETVPSMSGYTASQTKVGQQALGSVAASDVPMYNEDVVVTYTPDVQTTPSDGEGVPGEPTEPTGPTTPEEPTGTGSITGEIVPETPAPGEAISTTPEKGEKGSATSGNAGTSGTTDGNTGYAGTTQDVNGAAATVSSSQSKTSAASQGKLPQTNEQSHSEVGLGLLGLLTSMLGLVGLKRRKRDDG